MCAESYRFLTCLILKFASKDLFEIMPKLESISSEVSPPCSDK